MAKTKKAQAETEIVVTLAKGQSLVGPNVAHQGGDAVAVSLECAARWQERGMIDPLPEFEAKILADHLAAQLALAADAPAADAPALVQDTGAA